MENKKVKPGKAVVRTPRRPLPTGTPVTIVETPRIPKPPKKTGKKDA